MGCIMKGGGGLNSRVVIGAIVLAAGAGERIGRRPKCLLELGGVPLIRRVLVALSGAGVDELVVVLGHHAEAVAPVIECFPVTIVRNPHPDDGQVSSQRVGLGALSNRCDAVLMVLADQPLLNAQDITALISAWKKRPRDASVVYPEVRGERGNPVIFGSDVREQVLAGDYKTGCRQWQSRHPELVTPYVTDNRRYRVDIDTQEDVERFERETGHALRWPSTEKV
ncbi:nucleotidyltransferase family protein [Caballeronia sp. dw_19]|uniref:nucleotidyltransferase family protein n=1 Tax=Caballeronia sp. dw_19 TaxID=2719791 RepID=UPI001BD6A0AD|nr:nucleotidyltransferase family protein [Caballeronia sp. dw_19]